MARDGLVPNEVSYAAMGLQTPNKRLPVPVRDGLAAEHGVISADW